MNLFQQTCVRLANARIEELVTLEQSDSAEKAVWQRKYRLREEIRVLEALFEGFGEINEHRG